MADEITRSDKKRALLWIAFALFIFIGVIATYSFYEYDLSSDGIAATSGEVTGVFLFVFLIGFFANKRKLTAKLFSVCLLIASGIFFTEHFLRLEEAIEVKKGHDLISNAKSPEEIVAVASQNPDNKRAR